ncbi:Down syndrome cell adhesion molecule-like protein Dscam2 [Araneus ventricosus]|uniref:Down syndrome cell adhesion molecule-like protein Dscam2 n=1 Tax=Araneus ventricosus TaxID=182803 RepID=A0A4Y2A9G6_ARAVE|nr:Down syndrome cell adhesion molecule-like protein Dscam2 [Araneus ventricosus]
MSPISCYLDLGVSRYKRKTIFPDLGIITFSFPSHVKEGEKVFVTCTPKGEGRSIKFRWLRNRSEIQQNERIKIMEYPDISTLIISPVIGDDNGNYTCVIAEDHSTASYLEELMIQAPPHWIKQPENVETIEGNRATLLCNAGGPPQPRITWKKIDIPRVKEFSFPSQVSIGDRTSAMCFAEKAAPPVSFIWYKNGELIRSLPDVVIKTDEVFSVIIISPVSETSKGNYTCSIKNLFGEASYSTFLSVVAPPRWIVEPMNTSIRIGEHITLECNAAGSPFPRIEWKKIKGSVNLDKHKRFKSLNGTLILTSVKLEDEGIYECSAENGINPPIEKQIWIKVNG